MIPTPPASKTHQAVLGLLAVISAIGSVVVFAAAVQGMSIVFALHEIARQGASRPALVATISPWLWVIATALLSFGWYRIFSYAARRKL